MPKTLYKIIPFVLSLVALITLITMVVLKFNSTKSWETNQRPLTLAQTPNEIASDKINDVYKEQLEHIATLKKQKIDPKQTDVNTIEKELAAVNVFLEQNNIKTGELKTLYDENYQKLAIFKFINNPYDRIDTNTLDTYLNAPYDAFKPYLERIQKDYQMIQQGIEQLTKNGTLENNKYVIKSSITDNDLSVNFNALDRIPMYKPLSRFKNDYHNVVKNLQQFTTQDSEYNMFMTKKTGLLQSIRQGDYIKVSTLTNLFNAELNQVEIAPYIERAGYTIDKQKSRVIKVLFNNQSVLPTDYVLRHKLVVHIEPYYVKLQDETPIVIPSDEQPTSSTTQSLTQTTTQSTNSSQR